MITLEYIVYRVLPDYECFTCECETITEVARIVVEHISREPHGRFELVRMTYENSDGTVTCLTCIELSDLELLSDEEQLL